MFAIAFDMTVRELEAHHPNGVVQAYGDIASALHEFWFDRVQGSVYTCQSEDLANLLQAVNSLKRLPWFPTCVRDIRVFRVEQWSDFTSYIKQA